MNQGEQKYKLSFGGPLTPMVKILLWINGVVFFSVLVAGNKLATMDQTYSEILFSLFGISPQRVFGDFALWQLFTYMFLHSSFTHLLFNMLGLWWFGSDLEAKWGSSTFIRYYFFTGVGAGLVSAIFNMSTIGASGAIFGLLLAFGMSFPNRVMYIYFLFPVKAKYCVALFGGIELFSLVFSSRSGNINHAAHLSGLVFGFIWFALAKQDFKFSNWWRDYKRTRLKRRFKVIYPNDRSDDDQNQKNQTIH